MRISDWSSDVCSSDLSAVALGASRAGARRRRAQDRYRGARRQRFPRHADDRTARRMTRGFTSSRRSAQQGFTLIELPVALLIFATLSTAGVMLLSGTVSAQATVTARLDAMPAVHRASQPTPTAPPNAPTPHHPHP